MAAEKLMLQGRFYSKVRKYGVIGGVATLVGGVVTYIVVKQREKSMNNYFKSLTPEKRQEIDKRVMKFAGFERDERFPNIPMLNNKEGQFTSFLEKYKIVDYMLAGEKEVLLSVDPDLYDYLPDLFLSGIRDDWFESEAQKASCQKRLELARTKLLQSVRTSKKMESGAALTAFILLEIERQKKEGLQDVATPLAVKYLPKVE